VYKPINNAYVIIKLSLKSFLHKVQCRTYMPTVQEIR